MTVYKWENGASTSTGTIARWKGAWVTATEYSLDDGVSNDGSSYICILEHTAGAASEPGTGSSWTTYWNLVAQKGDTGPAPTLEVEIPSGDVDGLNVTFTVLNTPKMLVINGSIITESVDYSIVGLTITLFTAPPTGSIIRSFYV